MQMLHVLVFGLICPPDFIEVLVLELTDVRAGLLVRLEPIVDDGSLVLFDALLRQCKGPSIVTGYCR